MPLFIHSALFNAPRQRTRTPLFSAARAVLAMRASYKQPATFTISRARGNPKLHKSVIGYEQPQSSHAENGGRVAGSDGSISSIARTDASWSDWAAQQGCSFLHAELKQREKIIRAPNLCSKSEVLIQLVNTIYARR